VKTFRLAEERGGAEYEALAERLAKEPSVTHTGEWSHAECWRVVRPNGARLVIMTEVEEHDGKDWWHVSVSASDKTAPKGKSNRVPSYDELVWVKRVFIGEDAMAIQLFPKATEHVNIHPYCLHLWSPLGHAPLPDFRWNAGDGTTFGV
jgi:hypothetical protein